MNNNRSCLVSIISSDERKIIHKKAIFHRWVDLAYVVSPGLTLGSHNGGQIRKTLALVEYENGQIEKVEPNDVTFTDGLANRVLNNQLKEGA